MDHRCLYGHRIPVHFTFAVQARQCPTCGAPTVTVLGYQLARTLAEEVPLDPVKAFSAVRLIESRYALADLPAEVSEDEAVSEEIELSEEELGADVMIEEAPPPAAAPPAKASKPAVAAAAAEPAPAPAAESAPAPAKPATAKSTPESSLFQMPKGGDDETEQEFDSLDDEFFSESASP